jgi:DNA-binding CsgD family transcriptional regulator
LERFSKLIEALYEAALDPTVWSRVAPLVAGAFTAPSCALVTFDSSSGASAILGQTDNYDAKSVADYESYYHKVDIWTAASVKAGIGRPFVSQEFVSDAEVAASEIYNDNKRVGIFQALACTFNIEGQKIGGIGIHRPFGTPAFVIEERQELQLLLPHVTRAMQLHNRLGLLDRERQLAYSSLDSLGAGVMVVAVDGRLMFANRTAEAVLRAGQGITVRNGILRAQDRSAEGKLRLAIDQAAMAAIGELNSAGGIVVASRTARQPLTLLVCPLRPEALGAVRAQPVAMIFVGDPEHQPRQMPEVFVQLWGLTAAEARLTAALVEGQRMDSYADSAGISIQTAKSQLKAVFAKTGCKRQSDLIREVLVNPVLRMVQERTAGR